MSTPDYMNGFRFGFWYVRGYGFDALARAAVQGVPHKPLAFQAGVVDAALALIERDSGRSHAY